MSTENSQMWRWSLTSANMIRKQTLQPNKRDLSLFVFGTQWRLAGHLFAGCEPLSSSSPAAVDRTAAGIMTPDSRPLHSKNTFAFWEEGVDPPTLWRVTECISTRGCWGFVSLCWCLDNMATWRCEFYLSGEEDGTILCPVRTAVWFGNLGFCVVGQNLHPSLTELRHSWRSLCAFRWCLWRPMSGVWILSELVKMPLTLPEDQFRASVTTLSVVHF